MEIKIGDQVRYWEVMRYTSEFSDHTVAHVLPNGIPSCREPMVKLSGKAGYVLASHCRILSALPKAEVEG